HTSTPRITMASCQCDSRFKFTEDVLLPEKIVPTERTFGRHVLNRISCCIQPGLIRMFYLCRLAKSLSLRDEQVSTVTLSVIVQLRYSYTRNTSMRILLAKRALRHLCLF